MSLDVIGAGFGCTSTLPLKQALETVGIDRCYHMIEVCRSHLEHRRLCEFLQRPIPDTPYPSVHTPAEFLAP